MHTFHRKRERERDGEIGKSNSNNFKTTFISRCRNSSNQSAGGVNCGGSKQSSTGCYGDNTETSEDDEDYEQHEELALHAIETGVNCRNDGNSQELKENNRGKTKSMLQQQQQQHEQQVPISLVLLILICYICLGTVIFAFWENWSLVDGAYFCFVTLATIGYGDFLPERTFKGPEVQLFACCAYLLLGLVLVAMSFNILETQLMWKCKRIAIRLKLANE